MWWLCSPRVILQFFQLRYTYLASANKCAEGMVEHYGGKREAPPHEIGQALAGECAIGGSYCSSRVKLRVICCGCTSALDVGVQAGKHHQAKYNRSVEQR
jgi:hypothetical protein